MSSPQHASPAHTVPRGGYDADFLAATVPLPRSTSPRETRELPYVHFSVVLDPSRRLALATAVNIDGDRIVDVGRSDDWHLDARVPEDQQTGPAVYARNDLDRGHLVRRRDPVWGDGDEAEAANVDTFCYTNAAPQAAEFNQGKELWVGLEDHVLAYAEANDVRLSVFTGPVLDPSDPPYRGTRIPRRFWKVAAWTSGGGPDAERALLRSAAFLLDQSPQLDGLDLEENARRRAIADAPPPLGPFRTFQVPVGDVAAIAGLELGPLADADVLEPVPAATPGRTPDPARWRELSTWREITLR
ncbi:DNA/RNA non-specific endonuclease [Labedella endophytica]|uniref:DNA/RNA non-specific endonuclease n=1 Tax=Labedella endophytica TaxID=1523160 RepID=A0A3S1CUA3_9MICO|nr:DNA/RNA non-specific endonuclease [Labedella endophytica]RUR03287.1 DNA/RNA non-specific endonuclease [Labedella endophytica]